MADFDDPLADLLSEGSNDSFFEDPKASAKRSSIDKGKKLVDQPLGSKEKTSGDWLGLGLSDDEYKKDSLTKTQTKAEEKTKFTTNLDLDDAMDLDLGLDVKKPSSKKDIISKIMGEPKKEENISSFSDILQNSSIKRDNLPVVLPVKTTTSSIDTNLSVPLSTNQPANTTSASSTNIYAPAVNRESRRTRPMSSNLMDPLGLFDTSTKDLAVNETAVKVPVMESPKKVVPNVLIENEPKVKITSAMPDWLMGAEKKTEKVEVLTKKVEDVKPAAEDTGTKGAKPDDLTMSTNSIETLLTQQKMSSTHIELQNANLALQQQESQLMIALQLKKYEENLSAMQRSQQDILARQEAQFNALLERQFSKQQLIESSMRSTQERINSHIQLLLTQAPGEVAAAAPGAAAESRLSAVMSETIEENRKFYEDIIRSLKQKHQEEVFLLEESYKKQLSLLEANSEASELRLKTEIDSITRHFTQRLSEAAEEKDELVARHSSRMRQLGEEFQSELSRMRESHERIVQDVRSEYSGTLEDLKRNRQREASLLADAGAYTNRLDESVGAITDTSRKMDELQTRLVAEHSVAAGLRTEALLIKERELKLMSGSLEKQRELLEGERAQLMALVQVLEGRLVEQTQAAREERWALQHAAATFTARSQALDSEAAAVRKNLAREREQLEVAKKDFLEERERVLAELSERKLEVAAEKSRLETSLRLNQNYDQNKARAEVEAALQVARDAADLTDRERDNLQREQRRFEALRRTLTDREQRLAAREQQAEQRTQEADRRLQEAEGELARARMTETAFAARHAELGRQLGSLAAREKKLSQEKVALSRERVALHAAAKEAHRAGPCGLCGVSGVRVHLDRLDEDLVEQDVSRPFHVSHSAAAPLLTQRLLACPQDPDLELQRLKREIENDSDDSVHSGPRSDH